MTIYTSFIYTFQILFLTQSVETCFYAAVLGVHSCIHQSGRNLEGKM